mgnify:CR=1 FL=1
MSGRVHWRKRAIGALVERMSAGDTLIVSELSRLGRSMLECMEILSICIQRGINVYAVKGACGWITPSSPRSSQWLLQWLLRLNAI